MLDGEFLKIMAVLLAIASALIAPSIYYLRYNSNKNDIKNKELVDTIRSQNDKTLERLEKNQQEFNNLMRADLKEFKIHLDSRFDSVYSTIDLKLRELRDQMTKDMEYVRSHVAKLEGNLETQSEKAHKIEKDILKETTRCNPFYGKAFTKQLSPPDRVVR
jgi:ElaB/YqjD/DUF883 family membrane-anchored ribosome-binding protein